MKIAIDVGPTKSGDAVRGVGVYTRELIKGLKLVSVVNLDVHEVDAQNDDLSKFDLLHIPYFQPYFLTLPAKKQIPTIVTIHDVIPLIYSRAYPPGLKGRLKLILQKNRLKRIDHLITVSETSKKDIVRFLGVPQENISVIYEGPRDIFTNKVSKKFLSEVKNKYQLPDEFVLYVGDVNYNKNIVNLATACNLAKTHLIIVGKNAVSQNTDLSHQENTEYKMFLEKYGNSKKVLRTGFVPDAELAAVYKLATLYFQPSLYEGFGLAVIEAQAAGVPVIVARTNALTEIAGESALITDPKDVNDMARKILKLMKDPTLKRDLTDKGLINAERFSWNKTAKETCKVYSKIIGL